MSITNISNVVYGNGKIVAISSGSTKVSYSKDGTSWKSMKLSTSTTACIDSNFIKINDSNSIVYSNDGINWNEANVPDKYWDSVVFNGSEFVAISRDNMVIRSRDGINWI